ncbi:MAG: shikimate kinase [Negativicutes bacterium]|jgi:shikimate kinase
MTELEELRREINECDREIVQVMIRRLAAVQAVGEYKKLNKLGVYQPEREQAIIERIANMVADGKKTAKIVELYNFIMKQSRNIQMQQCINDNIVLTGFMACGKTTVGKELSEITGYSFIDTDGEIERLQQKKIEAIFIEQGEAAFRKYERAVVKQLSARRQCIIACGGGLVLDDSNVCVLRNNGKLVWLKLGLTEVMRRLKMSGGRPLADGIEATELVQLNNLRLEKYKKAADITIDVDGKSVSEICAEILKKCMR